VVALLLSVTASGVLLSSNAQLQSERNSSSTRLQMTTALGEGQMAVQNHISRLNALVTGLSVNCTQLGLNGTTLRAQINATMAADSCILSMITFDTHGIVIAAEPASNHFMEGINLSYSDNIARSLATKMPFMSDVLQPLHGPAGVALDIPVFDTAGVFQGGVSALYSISALMNGTLPTLSTGMPFTWWSMQLNGTEIYDTDPLQIGQNNLGPATDPFPQAKALSWRVVNESYGYGSYSFFVNMDTQQVVTKECYWSTVGLHGTQWRLTIVHRL
jgi:hypothetical protein